VRTNDEVHGRPAKEDQRRLAKIRLQSKEDNYNRQQSERNGAAGRAIYLLPRCQ
jgi:hypothetical protein